MGEQQTNGKGDDRASDDDYVSAQDVARMYGVSIHTIRRRIREGNIFKGAKKQPTPAIGGELWVIPRSEVAAVTLKDISPRTFFERRPGLGEPAMPAGRRSRSAASLRALEDRISVLEQLVAQLLERDA